MIVKLSVIISAGSSYLVCFKEDAGWVIEFSTYEGGMMILPCGGFNHALGFKMRYHVDEVDVYDNEIKLIKEI